MHSTGILKKGVIALSVVTLTTTVGVASANALSFNPFGPGFPFNNFNPFVAGFPFNVVNPFGYYSHSQCTDDNWTVFKNSDGNMKFKNQGQCISFFVHQSLQH